MSIRRSVVLGAVFVISLAGCEKASAPPPEAATAPAPTPPPAETAAPATSATSPVVETTPTTGSPEPSPTAASAPVVPPAASAPSAPSAGPASPAAASAHAGHPAKEHAEAPATPASPAAGAEGPTPDDACQTKNFHYTQVASACKSGGRKAVKAIMKGVVKKAKAAGTDLMCTSCHEDMKDFHLKPNAVGDLKNWL